MKSYTVKTSSGKTTVSLGNLNSFFQRSNSKSDSTKSEEICCQFVFYFVPVIMYKREKMQENFCLTFSKKKNIILVNE